MGPGNRWLGMKTLAINWALGVHPVVACKLLKDFSQQVTQSDVDFKMLNSLAALWREARRV